MPGKCLSPKIALNRVSVTPSSWWLVVYYGSVSNHLSRASGSHASHCVERPLYSALGIAAYSEPLSVIPLMRLHVYSPETFFFIS